MPFLLIFKILSMNKIIPILNFILLIFQSATCIYLINLHQQIPIHWGIDGNIDSYGKPLTSFILPFLALTSWGILIFLKRRPQYYNLPYNIKNRSVALSIVKEILDLISLWVFVLTSFLLYCILTAKLYSTILILLIILFACMIVYFTKKLSRC